MGGGGLRPRAADRSGGRLRLGDARLGTGRRQLGPPAGVIAAIVLSGILFTTGMSSLIDPVSSRVAGYPLLCGAVLLWCVLCGDVRLLPLTAAVVSFAAQQHLSVG